jgi:hypothetical protein
MPPPKSHKTLTPPEKETLRQWIEQGAKYQRALVFRAVRQSAAAARGKSDRRLHRRTARRGKTRVIPEADRETLIRRASFALTGLPPTVADVDTFSVTPPRVLTKEWSIVTWRRRATAKQMARHWLDVGPLRRHPRHAPR